MQEKKYKSLPNLVLNTKEFRNLYLDVWWLTDKKTYNTLYDKENGNAKKMIEQLVKIDPKKFRKIYDNLRVIKW